MGDGTVVPMTWPQTIYAVALSLSRAGETGICCRMFVVSGENPLTKAEAFERAAAPHRADGWTVGGYSVSWVVQKTGR